MRTAFILTTTLIGAFICFVMPFVATLRGGRVRKITFLTWVGLIVYTVFLILFVPYIVAGSDHEFLKEMQTHWVPEGPGIVAIVFVGWIYPLIAAFVGRALRSRFIKLPPVIETRIQEK